MATLVGFLLLWMYLRGGHTSVPAVPVTGSASSSMQPSQVRSAGLREVPDERAFTACGTSHMLEALLSAGLFNVAKQGIQRGRMTFLKAISIKLFSAALHKPLYCRSRAALIDEFESLTAALGQSNEQGNTSSSSAKAKQPKGTVNQVLVWLFLEEAVMLTKDAYS